MTNRAVFLDRDGVINVEGGGHVRGAEELRLLPGAVEAIARICRAGWTVIVFTNQSGVGRGYMTQDDLDSIHDRLRCEVKCSGGRLTAIYACPHLPDAGCDCRKPKPGMLIQAAREHDIELRQSYAVGDSPRDIAAAAAAGCTAVLVLSGHTAEYPSAGYRGPEPDYIFPDLSSFADWLLSLPAVTQ
jgi:D-glycero-D-manno-heptose 1,7-bisphosphate phosphatase